MRFFSRSAGGAFASLLAASVLSFTTALAPATAGTALVVGGVGQPTVPDWVMENLLAGRFADDTREDVYWPAEARPYTTGTRTLGQSVAVGTDNLYAAIMNSAVPITVVGMSGGSLVVDETMRRLLQNPGEAPTPADLTFVIIADSSRQQFINRIKYSSRLDYTYQPAPDTQYDVIVVTGEYDGFADFPDRWWNFTAVLNAYAGVLTEHIPTAFADLDEVPSENITITVNGVGGTTTHYLVPAKTLPLVKLFPGLKAREAELKRQIDSAYKRNDVTAASASLLAAPAATEGVAGETEDLSAAAETDAKVDGAGSDSGKAAPVAEPVADQVDEVDEVDGGSVLEDTDTVVDDNAGDGSDSLKDEQEAVKDELDDEESGKPSADADSSAEPAGDSSGDGSDGTSSESASDEAA
ncbi:PE-PPE domain-containing protein [Mycolicibacterium austroafricanum]|uniref:PE-PPE domain-containing protein n=1 Tax=Mycolicibacterium austroafricanum TaxID=39687 RepID=UPI001CA30393|nr:PE-PPE domain-containing protein [Mycolicibacterium austroafricanum]QZT64965.1 PE-PPE domain-containing protein [Mycolicibacterium austroafricanum]